MAHNTVLYPSQRDVLKMLRHTDCFNCFNDQANTSKTVHSINELVYTMTQYKITMDVADPKLLINYKSRLL
jgi:hypothetical protein